jgi:hypothetical protein
LKGYFFSPYPTELFAFPISPRLTSDDYNDSSPHKYRVRLLALSTNVKEIPRRLRRLKEDFVGWQKKLQQHQQHPFLTISDIYFGGLWFNMEVIRMINRRGLCPNTLLAVQFGTAVLEPRLIEIGEGSTSPKSAAKFLLDESDESEESFESTSSVSGHSLDQETLGDTWIQSTLAASKTKLVDCLMEDFWILFDQLQHENMVGHAGVSTSEEATTSSGNAPPLNSSSPVKRSKRDLDDQDDPESDEDSQKRYQPPREGSVVLDSGSSRPNFACPYRKHNPRKYNVTEWRPCSLTPHNTIARVK